jgi:hypothetical protein
VTCPQTKVPAKTHAHAHTHTHTVHINAAAAKDLQCAHSALPGCAGEWVTTLQPPPSVHFRTRRSILRTHQCPPTSLQAVRSTQEERAVRTKLPSAGGHHKVRTHACASPACAPLLHGEREPFGARVRNAGRALAHAWGNTPGTACGRPWTSLDGKPMGLVAHAHVMVHWKCSPHTRQDMDPRSRERSLAQDRPHNPAREGTQQR